jgi:ABC-type uncharacterized transport system ATPase subunit
VIIKLSHGQWVSTDHIKSVREINGHYEIYVDSPDYSPKIATADQFVKIVEAMNGNSN